MTETGIASGLQRLVEDINTTVPPRTSVPKANGNGNGEHSTDLGVENIKRAGELSAQTFRDAFEETARRAVELAEANLERARNDHERAQQFANALRQHGDALASSFEAGFARAASVAQSMAMTRNMIEGEVR